MYWFRRKYWQIKNIIKWLPVIWKQYDFDYHYSIDVFKFQLQKQAEFLESDKHNTLSAPQNAQRIRTVIKLMDRVYDDYYGCEYQDILAKKYGENVLNFNFEDCEDKPGYSTMSYEFEKWDNAEEIRKEHDKLFKECQERQEKAHRILWALIEKDIRRWWD